MCPMISNSTQKEWGFDKFKNEIKARRFCLKIT